MVETPGIIIPNDPDLIGIIEIRMWKNGLVRVSRPREHELALKMIDEARKIIVNKHKSEGGLILNMMPDLQKAIKGK